MDQGAVRKPGSRDGDRSAGSPPDVTSRAHIGNDNPAGAVTLPLDARRFDDIERATVYSGEPLTVLSDSGCRDQSGAIQDMDRTIWFRVKGTGGPMVATDYGGIAFPTGFHSIIAVHTATSSPSFDSIIGCDVGRQGTADADAFVQWDSTAGVDYLVQVGRMNGGLFFSDQVAVTVSGADLRRIPRPIPFGSETLANIATDLEPGEPVSCNGISYGSTLWLSFSTPAKGVVTYNASSTEFGPIAVLFPRNSSTPVVPCSVDADSLNARVSVDVPKGDYIIQVGAENGRQGGFISTLSFDKDQDVDDDGAQAASDCNDEDRNIRPGAPDVTNGRDDDCDNIVDPDRDGDGFLDRARHPQGQDCNDGNAAIRPGAREVPGNKVDENCDGIASDYLDVRASVRVKWDARSNRTRFTTMRFSSIEKGTTIRLTCRGQKRCPVRYKRTFRKSTRAFGLKRSKFMSKGTSLELRIVAPERIGKVIRWRMKGGGAQPAVKILCLRPGANKARRCGS